MKTEFNCALTKKDIMRIAKSYIGEAKGGVLITFKENGRDGVFLSKPDLAELIKSLTEILTQQP